MERDTITIRLDGHVTGGDMRAMTTALVPLLDAGTRSRVVSDLRRLRSFTPSAGSAAQLGVWNVRSNIDSVVVVGGTRLARTESRGACALLGVACSFVDILPPAE